MKYKTTTVHLNPDIWKRFIELLRIKDKSFSSWVRDKMREELSV